MIYRRAERAEKKRFKDYVVKLLQDDYIRIVENWKQIKGKCGLPIEHKVAIDLFILKYRRIMRNGF